VSKINWLQEITNGILDVQQKLEIARPHLGNNPKVLEDYETALKSVRATRADLDHFAGVFDAEYR
jgi:hypothetical protein